MNNLQELRVQLDKLYHNMGGETVGTDSNIIDDVINLLIVCILLKMISFIPISQRSFKTFSAQCRRR